MTDHTTGRVAILGAGVMGTGIASLAVGCGVPVILVDIHNEILAQARASVAQQLRLAQFMGVLPTTGPTAELETTSDISQVAGATVVIESVTERVELKARALTGASAVISPGTLVVSNTSAIPIDQLAQYLPRPEDLVGIHFMNPPYLIRTVELIRGPRSSDVAMRAAERLLADLGQTPVLVSDGPGFVINRILQRAINEAVKIVQEGIATPEAVDAAFTSCLGHRTGPLATADLIGLDNIMNSLRVLLERTGDEGYHPCDLLLAKVKAGELGRKTGRGFFDHKGAQ